MRIGTENEHLDLELLGRDGQPGIPPRRRDLQVKATLKLQEFGGSYSGVWLFEPDVVRFVDELQAIVESRRGTAKLDSMSPGELTLELRPTDPVGHFELSVRMSRHQWSGPTYWPTTVSGGFEVDPTCLPAILRDFEALLASDVGA
jgi:hypothetical protein